MTLQAFSIPGIYGFFPWTDAALCFPPLFSGRHKPFAQSLSKGHQDGWAEEQTRPGQREGDAGIYEIPI